MSTASVETLEPAALAEPGAGLSLDDLLTKDTRALRALYVAGVAPNLRELDGFFPGRFLAGLLGRRALPGPLRTFGRSSLFPWRGKIFRALGADTGEGVNVWFPRIERFAFRTHLATSRAGAFDALQLDYDLPGNPLPLRAVKDEMRRIAPGLWLGQMYYPLVGGLKLVTYFAVGARP